MKNLTATLSRGNLTAKERYLLLIQNDVIKAQTGKEPLSEADKEALAGWKAENNEQAKEWNKYNDGWQRFARAGMEVELIYSQTASDNFRKHIIDIELATYPSFSNIVNKLKGLKHIKQVDIKEAVEITNKQREQKLKDGVDFDYATHELAFESLSDEVRKDILILDQEASYEPSYLEDEETIANLLKGKEELSKEAMEKYAELVAERSYNEFAKEYQLHGNFASLPIKDLAMKWAKDNKIKPRKADLVFMEKMESKIIRNGKAIDRFYADIKKERGNAGIADITDEEFKEFCLLEDNLKELLEEYAKENKTTIKEILRETCLKWIKEGLPYTPLVISKDKDTYNGKTKLPHNELFKEWIKTKVKAKETLEKLINKGELKIRERTAEEIKQDKLHEKGKRDIIDFSDKVITGESLYNFKGDYKFIKDFKERVDNYEANLGLVYAERDADGEGIGDNLDTELIITGKENTIFSYFDLAQKASEALLKLKSLNWKETEKDGEIYLEFKSDEAEIVFKETRDGLIKGYAKLLAFKEIFKKLEKLYEIDMGFFINDKIKSVGGFIDHHNLLLDNAIENTKDNPLKMKEDLAIEIEGIKPDTEILKEYTEKFKQIFGDEF